MQRIVCHIHVYVWLTHDFAFYSTTEIYQQLMYSVSALAEV